MDEAKRIAPSVADNVALIRLDFPCQIHTPIAQQWRGCLRSKIVIAANKGYRPGSGPLATRSATGRDLIDFIANHRPPIAVCNASVVALGFPRAKVQE